jgi:hypothetical protein
MKPLSYLQITRFNLKDYFLAWKAKLNIKKRNKISAETMTVEVKLWY